MACAALYRFVGDFVLVRFKLLRFQLCQIRQARNLLLQNSQGLFALAAALIVFGVHQASLLVRVADHQLIRAGHKRNQAVLQRVAHQQDRLVTLAVGYGELVHNPGVYAHVLVLRTLRQQGDFHSIRISAEQRQEGEAGNHFDGSRGGQARAVRNLAMEQEVITCRDRKIFFGQFHHHTYRIVHPFPGFGFADFTVVNGSFIWKIRRCKLNLAVAARPHD
ncbi:hypothetical protein D3C87_1377670 [compost metagenome]